MTHTLRQSEAAECGLVCVAIASTLLGAEVALATLRRRHPVSVRGLSLIELAQIAASLNLSARPLRVELSELDQLTAPAILHWGLSHFVVFEKCLRGGKVRIHDPALGRLDIDLAEVSKRFTGAALELLPAPDFKKRKEKSPLSLASWFRFTPTVTGGLVQVLLLSLLLQVYVLASPFYMQLAIDQAALKGDKDLLTALAVGFGLFAAFNAGAEAFRSLAAQRLTALLNWDMTLRLFRHMLRLPLPWFQRRKLADILSRFDSIGPVRDLISGALVAVLIDGVLSLVTLAMMLVFAPWLALVALGGLLAYAAIRLAAMPWSLRLGMDSLSAHITENGKKIESVRAIQTVKVMGAETVREGDWSNSFAQTIKADQKQAQVDIGFNAVHGLVDALVTVALVYMGARAVMEAKMSVGMLYAFMAYKGQFMSRASGLFEQVVHWQLTDMYSFRLADIVLTPKEEGIDTAPVVSGAAIAGAIEADQLSFRYAPHEPFVLQQVSFSIQPGEFVAIIGPSGGGKSTLLKVLTGLYPLTGGEVRLDGRPLSAYGAHGVRRALGVVMQDDDLLGGSIAENVAFFDDQIDMDKVWKCLDMAAVAQEIAAMPMKAETLVGDMGGALSGGQKQRVLLARALYRDPKILILDEATSHLDINRERNINEALRGLSMTRLIVAHRPETIAAADRFLIIDKSTLVADQRRNDLVIRAVS